MCVCVFFFASSVVCVCVCVVFFSGCVPTHVQFWLISTVARPSGRRSESRNTTVVVGDHGAHARVGAIDLEAAIPATGGCDAPFVCKRMCQGTVKFDGERSSNLSSSNLAGIFYIVCVCRCASHHSPRTESRLTGCAYRLHVHTSVFPVLCAECARYDAFEVPLAEMEQIACILLDLYSRPREQVRGWSGVACGRTPVSCVCSSARVYM